MKKNDDSRWMWDATKATVIAVVLATLVFFVFPA